MSPNPQAAEQQSGQQKPQPGQKADANKPTYGQPNPGAQNKPGSNPSDNKSQASSRPRDDEERDEDPNAAKKDPNKDPNAKNNSSNPYGSQN